MSIAQHSAPSQGGRNVAEGYVGCVLGLIASFLRSRRLTRKQARLETGLNMQTVARYFKEFASRGWIRPVGTEAAYRPGVKSIVWEWVA